MHGVFSAIEEAPMPSEPTIPQRLSGEAKLKRLRELQEERRLAWLEYENVCRQKRENMARLRELRLAKTAATSRKQEG
jgi:hypothetical protein